MALLSQLFRRAAITGRTDPLDASWFAGRQGGRWAAQTVSSALHQRPRPDAAARRRDVEDLRRRGVISAAEADALNQPNVNE
jgi:hypothetical protein